MLQLYKESVANPADFTLLFTGNVEIDSLKREFGISNSIKSRISSLKKLPILLVISLIFSNLEEPNNKYDITITESKVTEIFCIADDFCKEFEVEMSKNALSSSADATKRRRKRTMSDAEVITIPICFHFNTYRNFKHYYLSRVCGQWKHLFPRRFSYNRFVEVMPRCFVALTMFLRLACFGECTGISFVDSTCIPVIHNKREFSNLRYSRALRPRARAPRVVCWLQATPSVQRKGRACEFRPHPRQCR